MIKVLFPRIVPIWYDSWLLRCSALSESFPAISQTPISLQQFTQGTGTHISALFPDYWLAHLGDIGRSKAHCPRRKNKHSYLFSAAQGKELHSHGIQAFPSRLLFWTPVASAWKPLLFNTSIATRAVRVTVFISWGGTVTRATSS